MKKLWGFIIICVFAAVTILVTYFHLNIDTIIYLSVAFIIITFLLLFEIKKLDARKIAAVSTLSAIGGVLRVPFAPVPGLQPTTFIVAVSGYTLGPVNGFMVGAMSAFISNFFLGQGPWTLWQMLGWGLCGFFFGMLKEFNPKDNVIIFTIFCGLWGYIFGAILDMWYVVAIGTNITIKTVLSGIAASFYFDTIHAIGNLFFSMLLCKSFIKTLDRFNKRYTVEYVE